MMHVNYRGAAPFLGDIQLRSLPDLVMAHAARTPHKAALLQRAPDGSWTPTSYAELATESLRYAEMIRTGSGLLPIYSAKSPTSIAVVIGALIAGRPFSCLNRKLRPAQIDAILNLSGASECVVDDAGVLALRRTFLEGWPSAHVQWHLLPSENDALRGPLSAILGKIPEHARPAEWVSQPAGSSSSLDPELESDAKRVGAVLFTSGSTGVPKGVLIGEHDLRARAYAEIDWFELTSEDVLLCVLPFSFDVGLNQLCSALSAGATLALLDSWLPADIVDAVAKARITGISAVPAIWQDMLNANLSFDTAGAHKTLRYITISGGDMPPSVLARVPSLASGVRIYKTYGQTEAFRATSLHPEEFETRMQSVGRPFRGVRLAVVREDGTRCEANEVGEVVHAGLGVMLGYLDGEQTETKLRAAPALGEPHPVIHTGDLGYLDEEGYLFLKGRRDGMLKVANNRVYPQEVVAQVLRLHGVADAHVNGVKGDDGDTRLVAFVVMRERTVEPNALRRELSELLPTYMIPHEIVLVDALPRTETGKPDQAALMVSALELVNRTVNQAVS